MIALTDERDLITTAINGRRTSVVVTYELLEQGHVNVFTSDEWQGTNERGGLVSFVDSIVVERVPKVEILSVYHIDTPVTIDSIQRDLIAYQLTNELPQTRTYYTGLEDCAGAYL